jgi:SAM-dependent methyltransferase
VTTARCLSCGADGLHPILDLGMHPPSEAFLAAEHGHEPELFHPLTVVWCPGCTLMQLDVVVDPIEIFDDYAYFSSYSTSWLEHARRHVEGLIDRFDLTTGSLVVEIASNDGYLLKYVLDHGIDALGIEPARTVADAAEAAGVPTIREFFDDELAETIRTEHGAADVIIANNVLAQVPQLPLFIAGLPTLLAEGGVVTIEVPHVARLLAETQFDTIYHEHYSYFSLHSLVVALGAAEMAIFDVEELPTHGGSLRIFAQHRAHAAVRPPAPSVELMLQREVADGLTRLDPYIRFAADVRRVKFDLLEFLIAARRDGKQIVGYGAAGKGNTLLNYCGIRTDLIDFLVDRNPYKHGRLSPGTHIPIRSPDAIDEARPDVIVILPWNLRDEIAIQLAHTREWGCEMVVPIPQVRRV